MFNPSLYTYVWYRVCLILECQLPLRAHSALRPSARRYSMLYTYNHYSLKCINFAPIFLYTYLMLNDLKVAAARAKFWVLCLFCGGKFGLYLILPLIFYPLHPQLGLDPQLAGFSVSPEGHTSYHYVFLCSRSGIF